MRSACLASLVITSIAGCVVLDPFSELARDSPDELVADASTNASDDVTPLPPAADRRAEGVTDPRIDLPTGKLGFTLAVRSAASNDFVTGPMVALAANGEAVTTFGGFDSWTLGTSGPIFPAPDSGILDYGFVRVDRKGAVELAKRVDLGLMEAIPAVALDANDGLWFAGYRYKEITETSYIEPLVGKMDASGSIVFRAGLRCDSPSSWFVGRVIRVAKGGQIVVGLNFIGTIGWTNVDGSEGTATSTTPSSAPFSTEDAFVAELDPVTGRVVWSRMIRGAEYEYVFDLAVDAQGDVYVAGQFDSASLEFPDVTRVGTRANALVTKLAGSDGHPIWSRTWGDSVDPPVLGPNEGAGPGAVNSVAARAIAIDERGHVAVGGAYRGTVDFGNGIETVAAVPGFYVSMLDAKTGKTIWLRDGRGTIGNGGNLQALAFDQQGYLVALAFGKGPSAGAIGVFAGRPFPTAGNASVLAAKMSIANGDVAWIKTVVAGVGGSATPFGLAVAPSGRSVATVVVRGTADLGDGTPVSAPAFLGLVGWDP